MLLSVSFNGSSVAHLMGNGKAPDCDVLPTGQLRNLFCMCVCVRARVVLPPSKRKEKLHDNVLMAHIYSKYVSSVGTERQDRQCNI